jgi:hypothetical protein
VFWLWYLLVGHKASPIKPLGIVAHQEYNKSA